MFKSLTFFLRYYLFWLLFFALDRFIFMFWFHKKLRHLAVGEKMLAFYHGLTLDLSMAAYISIIPILIYLAQYFSGRQTLGQKPINIYSRVLIVAFSILTVANYDVYLDWGSKINAQAIRFLIDTPKEAMASSSSSPLLLSFTTIAICIASGLYLYFTLLKPKVTFIKTALPWKIAIALGLFFINFLFIRGGLGTAPNTQSDAYYSQHDILNIASLNTEWNLISSMLASGKADHNPFIYHDPKESEQAVKQLYSVNSDTTIQVLKIARPNLVLFILESFTADIVQKLGGEIGVTPTLDSLIDKGILFSKIYAAGNRTDKGVVGTLTGFPTLATGSIVKWPEKMAKLPAISQNLDRLGYGTSFFYGGESEFDNYKAFILSHGYQKLVDKNNFEKKDMNSKWGAYDGKVFNADLAYLNTQKQPFFSTILSLTNHEPFELPSAYKFGHADNAARFKSTAFYTDSCIGSYLQQAKKQPWYANTLFIFVADHGHGLPKNQFEIFRPERYHIPLILFGDVIKDEFKGKKFDQVGSQQDIASTLLHQLGDKAEHFNWSKNLLNPRVKHFAFYTWDNGFGFVDASNAIGYDNIGKNVLFSAKKEKKSQAKPTYLGQSYLQTAYQHFIKL